jgi:hypothetical protein
VKAHANLLRTLEGRGRLASTMLLGTGNKTEGALTEDVSLLRQCVARERIGVLEQLNPADVSRHLAEADLFLSHYNGETADESSAFMAALAGRCPALLLDGGKSEPLEENRHFIASDDSHVSVRRVEQMISDGRLDQIATAGRLWYEQHAEWNVIARKCHEAICHQALFGSENLICPERPNLWGTRPHTAVARVHQTV